MAEKSRCPVCGMEADQDQAKRKDHTSDYQGRQYYFCSAQCRDDFDEDPDVYARKAESSPSQQQRR